MDNKDNKEQDMPQLNVNVRPKSKCSFPQYGALPLLGTIKRIVRDISPEAPPPRRRVRRKPTKDSKKSNSNGVQTHFPGYVDLGIDIEECIRLVQERST